MKNTPAAINKIGFRPHISENFPQEGVLAALASKYAEPIQVYPAFEWKCSEMVGRAVVIIETSRAARKTEEQSDIMIIVVCNFVREASGSWGEGPGGAAASAFAVTSSDEEGSLDSGRSMLLSFEVWFSESTVFFSVFSAWVCCAWFCMGGFVGVCCGPTVVLAVLVSPEVALAISAVYLYYVSKYLVPF